MDREEALSVLDRLHEAQAGFYAGGGAGALREVLTEDIAWHVPGDNAIAGTYAGLEAVLAYMARRRDLADRTFRMFPGEMLVGDGARVAVCTDGAATIGGREWRWSTVGLYELRDGRIAACWLLPLDPVAFDAAWQAR